MPEIITGQDSGTQYEASGGAEEAAKVDAARAELVDEANADAGNGLILGKYETTEDLASAYQNLQREYARLKSGQPSAEPEGGADAEAEAEGEEAEDEGPRIDPQRAAEIQDSIFRQAGGEAEYNRLAQWAARNLDSSRTEAYNEALRTGDEGAALTALKAIQYDYMMQKGYEPRLIGGRGSSGEVRPFDSERQVVEAMRDPRYSGDNPDPAYIKEVERRIAASNVFQSR